MLTLPAADRRWYNLPIVSPLPEDAPPVVLLIGDLPPTPTTYNEDRSSCRVLLAGPDGDNADSVLVPVGTHKVRAQLDDYERITEYVGMLRVDAPPGPLTTPGGTGGTIDGGAP